VPVQEAEVFTLTGVERVDFLTYVLEHLPKAGINEDAKEPTHYFLKFGTQLSSSEQNECNLTPVESPILSQLIRERERSIKKAVSIVPNFVYDINKGVEMYLVLLELVSTGTIVPKFVCAINKDVGVIRV